MERDQDQDFGGLSPRPVGLLPEPTPQRCRKCPSLGPRPSVNHNRPSPPQVPSPRAHVPPVAECSRPPRMGSGSVSPVHSIAPTPPPRCKCLCPQGEKCTRCPQPWDGGVRKACWYYSPVKGPCFPAGGGGVALTNHSAENQPVLQGVSRSSPELSPSSHLLHRDYELGYQKAP